MDSINVQPELRPTEGFSLNGRVAFVTGASSGLGRHIAHVLAGAGASVALAARRVELVEAEARRLQAIGRKAIAVPLDVTDVASIDGALDTASAHLGRDADIVVNCAGVLVIKPFLEHTARDYARVMDTNLRGAFFVAQRAALRMVSLGGGSIINVASTAGIRPGGYLSGYSASKAALIHLTKVMALELARQKIRVNVLCPGNFETHMHQEFVDLGFADALVKRIPQRRFGQPSDLDGAVLLLASDAGRYMTGSSITVDGGQIVTSL